MRKVCRVCREEKDLEVFVTNKTCRNGKANICKSCSAFRKRKQRRKTNLSGFDRFDDRRRELEKDFKLRDVANIDQIMQRDHARIAIEKKRREILRSCL